MTKTKAVQAIDVLASFVPVLIRERLAARPEPIGNDVDRFRAAVLFSDISGFTKLAERLGDHGPTGLEELTNALNSYFERLIALIVEHGGDVVKMAGDALIAVWKIEEGEADSLSAATIRAAACAKEVQANLQNVEAGEGVRLTSKIGIDAGEVLVLHVGGQFDRWEMLVAGAPIVGVGAAEHLANPGEIVLAPNAWEAVRSACEAEALAGGFARLRHVRTAEPRRPSEPVRLDSRSAPAISAYIPAAIRGRLAAGQTAWLAELRKLSVLFVDLPRIDFDAPDALDRVQRITAALQAALYRHEGSVNKLTVDEKGWALVAALGLPPLAHEDDAQRALKAAEAMRSALVELGEERVSIGIATGRVYCGVIGGETRREYTVIGRAVNLAARLMQAARAHRDVLCDEPTRRAADSVFEFEALPPLSLKNIPVPVASFRPAGKTLRRKASKPTVGRDRERALIRERLDDLKNGRGSVLVFEGDPGIGKSQLVGETVAECEALGWACFRGAADPIERSSPYHAWRSVLAKIMGIEDVDDLAVRRARVLERLSADPDSLRLAPLLNSPLALDLEDNELTAHMLGVVRADNTNDLILWLIQSVVDRGPTLIVVEDLHFFDSASWSLFLAAARRIEPVLLVAAARPRSNPLPEDYARLFELPGTYCLPLEPLSANDSVALAAQNLGVDSLPAEIADLIRRKAQGNPFFSEELAFALRDGKWIEIVGRRCRVAAGVDLRSIAVPDHVEGIVNNRIDRLSPPQQLALKIAGVIGRMFAVRLLRDLYPIEPDREWIPVYLEALARVDLIAADDPEPEPAYIFRHAITRDVVYDMLPFARRRELHRAVAEWYETKSGADAERLAPLLAYHWSGAGEDDKAIGYLDIAGRQALRGGSYREAVDFFNDAVAKNELLRPGEKSRRTVEWEHALGEAWLSLGNLAESRVHAERALRLADRPVPAPAALIPAFLGEIVRQVDRRLRPGLPAPKGSEIESSLRTASSAYGLISQLCYYDQNRILGVHSALRALNLAEKTEACAEAARAAAVMCLAAGLIPHGRLARRYADIALDIGARVGDLAAKAWTLQLTGMYDLGIGRWESARNRLEEAVRINRRLGDWRRWEESSGELARLEYYVGSFESAAARFREFGAIAKARRHVQALAWSLHGSAKVLFRLGRVSEALAALDEARSLPEQAIGHGDLILREGVRALIHLERNELEPARDAAKTAAEFIRQTPPIVSYTLEGYAGVAETFIRLFEAEPEPHRRRALNRDARQAVLSLERSARLFPVGRPRAALCRGLWLWADGRRAQAFRLWKRGVQTADDLSMPFEKALLLQTAATRLEPNDPARRPMLSQAISSFERVEARLELNRAQAALDRTC